MKKLIVLLLLLITALACLEPALAATKKKRIVKRRYYRRIKFNGPASMKHTTTRPIFPVSGAKKTAKKPAAKTVTTKNVAVKKTVIEKKSIAESVKKPLPPPKRYLVPGAGAGNGTFLLGLNYQQSVVGKLNFLLGGGWGLRRGDSSFTMKAGGLIDLGNDFFAGAALDIAKYADQDASGLGLFAGKSWEHLNFSVGYSSSLGFNALGGYAILL